MPKFTRRSYVQDLPFDIMLGIANRIKANLEAEGYPKEEIKFYIHDALNSRMCDLDYLINVSYWLDKANGVK